MTPEKILNTEVFFCFLCVLCGSGFRRPGEPIFLPKNENVPDS